MCALLRGRNPPSFNTLAFSPPSKEPLVSTSVVDPCLTPSTYPSTPTSAARIARGCCLSNEDCDVLVHPSQEFFFAAWSSPVGVSLFLDAAPPCYFPFPRTVVLGYRSRPFFPSPAGFFADVFLGPTRRWWAFWFPVFGLFFGSASFFTLYLFLGS